MRAMIVVGTRPEIIKMASVIDACKKFKLAHFVVHTGQHYDNNMSSIFIHQLGIKPDYYLNVGSSTHAVQTARAMIALEKVMIKEKPDIVLSVGDTNTVLAAGLAAVKQHVPVGHIEAGLRSNDLRMPEEHNRRLVDHVSTWLFAPTKTAHRNLEEEHVWGSKYITGNTVIDACLKYMPIAAKESKIMKEIALSKFALATVHREENIENKKVISDVLKAFTRVELPVVFVAHPRTLSRLKTWSQLSERIDESRNVKVIPAVGYFDFLVLMKNCAFIISDSGGIQEEATASNIRKFVFVLRESTERPESVDAGFAKVVGTNANKILNEVKTYLACGNTDLLNPSPYGDGRAGERVIQVIRDEKIQLRHINQKVNLSNTNSI